MRWFVELLLLNGNNHDYPGWLLASSARRETV